jgi:hypothetical protein
MTGFDLGEWRSLGTFDSSGRRILIDLYLFESEALSPWGAFVELTATMIPGALKLLSYLLEFKI